MSLPEFSEEELENFLDEVGVFTDTSSITPINTQDESLEKLLDEVIGTPVTPLDLPSEKRLFFPEHDTKKTKPFNVRYGLLYISLAILMSFFGGTLFGFFWGKSEKIIELPFNPLVEEIDAKLSILVSEMKEIHDSITVKELDEEIIEPFTEELKDPLEKLVPEAIL